MLNLNLHSANKDVWIWTEKAAEEQTYSELCGRGQLLPEKGVYTLSQTRRTHTYSYVLALNKEALWSNIRVRADSERLGVKPSGRY